MPLQKHLEAGKYLAVNRVSVTARAYRPPEVENYRFEIQNIATAAEADSIAKDARPDKEKIEELSRANSDLNNLMTSTDLATIFLDRQLRVREALRRRGAVGQPHSHHVFRAQRIHRQRR